MLQKSSLDVAYELVLEKNEPVAFDVLWAKVVEEQNFTEEEANARIAMFYTNLSLDGRFITLGENTWDLRDRYTFDKVHIDMNDVYRDVETEVFVDDEKEVIDESDDKEEDPFSDEDESVFEKEEDEY